MSLAHKRAQKARQPPFTRHNTHKKVRIKDAWRRPRGIHNKRRHNFRGYGKTVQVGYRSPVALRHAGPAGEPVIRIAGLAQLKGVAEGTSLIVASTLGGKARLAVLEHANKAGLRVLNLDAARTAAALSADFERRRQATRAAAEKKKAEAARLEREAKKAEEKKAEEKAAAVVASPEEKKAEEKLEQDKILTKKDGGAP